MKLLILAITLCIVAAKPNPPQFDFKGCATELGISKEDYMTMKEDDPRKNCIFACALGKYGLVKDGRVDFDVAFNITKTGAGNKLDDHAITEEINTCSEMAHKETNQCNVGPAFVDCMANTKENNSM